MSLNEMIVCPRCGLKLPDKQLFPNDRYNVSGESFELYGQLLGYTLSQNGRQVQKVHMRIPQQIWPRLRLDLPTHKAIIKVFDVLEAQTDKE